MRSSSLYVYFASPKTPCCRFCHPSCLRRICQLELLRLSHCRSIHGHKSPRLAVSRHARARITGYHQYRELHHGSVPAGVLAGISKRHKIQHDPALTIHMASQFRCVFPTRPCTMRGDLPVVAGSAHCNNYRNMPTPTMCVVFVLIAYGDSAHVSFDFWVVIICCVARGSATKKRSAV